MTSALTTDLGTDRVVDVHAHLLLPAVEQAVAEAPGLAEHRALDARRNGAESMQVSGAMVGARLPQLLDVTRRISDMDAAGVDVQLVSPSPSHYHYWAPPELARTVCRLANEGVAAHCAQHPGRLVGLGLVPLQHPDLAVDLLEHAVVEQGMVGVEISSHAPSDGTHPVELSDPRLEAFWGRASELGAVVFVHPFGCTLDERLDRWYLSNIVGQPVENAVALSHLIFSGVLDRHPALRVLVAHGGGYLPTFLGRSDHGWRVRPESRGCARTPSSYLQQLWFDSLVHTSEALRALVSAVGADRVVLGSDYPFDMGVADPVARLSAAMLPAADELAIRSGNAHVLGLVPSPAPSHHA